MIWEYEAMHPVQQEELERVEKKRKRGRQPDEREKLNKEGTIVTTIPPSNIEGLISTSKLPDQRRKQDSRKERPHQNAWTWPNLLS
jgi:hypothetical protein